METRLFSRDEGTGITRWFHYDHTTDDVTIETVQDVTGIVEGNKAEYASIDERARWKDGLGNRVATIPLSVLSDLQRKGIYNHGTGVADQKAMTRWLNDPDNRFFRTRPGRI